MRDNTGQHRNWKMRIQIVLRFFSKGVGVLWFTTSNVKFCMITFNQKFWSIPRFLWVTLIDQRSIAIQSWWEQRVEVYSPRWPSYDLLQWLDGWIFFTNLRFPTLLMLIMQLRTVGSGKHLLDTTPAFLQNWNIPKLEESESVIFCNCCKRPLKPPPHENVCNDSVDDDGGVKSERDSLMYSQSRFIAALLDDPCCWYLNFCFDHLYFPDNREL